MRNIEASHSARRGRTIAAGGQLPAGDGQGEAGAAVPEAGEAGIGPVLLRHCCSLRLRFEGRRLDHWLVGVLWKRQGAELACACHTACHRFSPTRPQRLLHSCMAAYAHVKATWLLSVLSQCQMGYAYAHELIPTPHCGIMTGMASHTCIWHSSSPHGSEDSQFCRAYKQGGFRKPSTDAYAMSAAAQQRQHREAAHRSEPPHNVEQVTV